VRLELAAPLPPEEEEGSREVQRVITLFRYGDTRSLRALLGVIESVNKASGMLSASAWDAYKEAGEDTVDLITGFQLADAAGRLFVLEGRRAAFDEEGKPLNGMGRLVRQLERRAPNERMAWTLMDTSLT